MRSQRMHQLSLQRLDMSDSQVPTKVELGGHVISKHFVARWNLSQTSTYRLFSFSFTIQPCIMLWDHIRSQSNTNIKYNQQNIYYNCVLLTLLSTLSAKVLSLTIVIKFRECRLWGPSSSIQNTVKGYWSITGCRGTPALLLCGLNLDVSIPELVRTTLTQRLMVSLLNLLKGLL